MNRITPSSSSPPCRAPAFPHPLSPRPIREPYSAAAAAAAMRYRSIPLPPCLLLSYCPLVLFRGFGPSGWARVFGTEWPSRPTFVLRFLGAGEWLDAIWVRICTSSTGKLGWSGSWAPGIGIDRASPPWGLVVYPLVDQTRWIGYGIRRILWVGEIEFLSNRL